MDRKEYARVYRRSKWGLVVYIYHHQIQRSKHKDRPLPEYTKEQLYNWCIAQSVFHKLYNNWIEMNYHRHFTPSVDRKDATRHYTFDNIQLMTAIENNIKGHNENVELQLAALKKWQKYGGLLGSKAMSKKVKQYSKDGMFIKEYKSLSSAARIVGCKVQNISAAIRGKYRTKTAGGYKWEYA